jgi:hypothetical protein
MNVNPMQLINLIKNGNNSQQLVLSLLQQQGRNNPILNNAASLAKQGNASALEMLARNLAQQRGLDFDTEFANFKNYLN